MVWERQELENRILSSNDARASAIACGLLPPDVLALLPSNPESLRTGAVDVGLEMEYRYWITDEEADKLDHVIDTLERLGLLLSKETPSHKYFELVSLAVPNWSTFLRLFQAQVRLQIRIRDYLLAQASNVGAVDLMEYAERLKGDVDRVRELGDSSYHVD